MSNDVIAKLKQAVVEQNSKSVELLAQQVLKEGIEPFDAISKGLCMGMQEIGELWKQMVIFLPEVMASAEAFYAGLGILRPHLRSEDVGKHVGTIVIGSIWGDLHTVGKDICIPVFEGEGFNVIDLGVDVKAEQFIEAIKKYNPDVVGLGTYMSETFFHTKLLVQELREAGIVGDLPLIVCGGPAVDREAAIRMGADDAFRDAWEAVHAIMNKISLLKGCGKSQVN